MKQEFDCIENPEGELAYNLRPNKFNNVYSITLVVNRNYGADFTKIYYIGFLGFRTNKKKFILVGNYELKPLVDKKKTKDEGTQHHSVIYG